MSIEPAAAAPGMPAEAEPSLASFEHPSPRVCIVWLASRMAFWVIAISGVAIARALGYLSAEWWTIWAFTPSLAWVIPPIHIALPLLSYRSWGYQLREHDLLVRHGVITREYVAVPLARVQQVGGA